MSDADLFTDAPAPDAGLFTDEPAPYFEDVVKNAGREISAIPGSIPTMAKQALGVANAPLDALKAVPQMLMGKKLGETDIAEDVKPIIEGNKQTINTIEHPVDSFRKAPINTAGTALGLLGAVKGMIPEVPEEVPPVKAPLEPEAPVPETPKPAEPPAPAPEAASPAEALKAAPSLKDLPVMQPGTNTGPAHALFAYNDTFGPNQTSRSIYNVFGDPGDPILHQVGGYGTSITKDILDKAGIPIVGREPRSVGKWEPLDVEAEKPTQSGVETPTTTPPGEAGGAKAATEPPPVTPKPSLFETGAQNAVDQAKELKDYISKGYEGYAKKPGAIADVADWVQEKSQMMAAQQIGVTPNQFRQLGKTPLEAHNAARAIGQYALDHEIVSPTTGLSGMLEKNATLTKSVGKTLGDYREMADKLAGEIDPKDVVKEVREALDKKYMRTITTPEGETSAPRGAYGGQSSAYLKALQEVEDAEKSHSGIAEAATELNHAANKAAKNMQPETPFTDVANEVSRINNAKIKALIGEENAAKYEQALREYGVNKKIANALKFKSSGEVKRFGPGSTLSNLTQKAMDELGYRFGAKTANKLSSAIKANPAMGGSLPSIFKEFINQVEDIAHDVSGLAHGGMVPDDVRKYVGCK
jgi:hypothetical protein